MVNIKEFKTSLFLFLLCFTSLARPSDCWKSFQNCCNCIASCFISKQPQNNTNNTNVSYSVSYPTNSRHQYSAEMDAHATDKSETLALQDNQDSNNIVTVNALPEVSAIPTTENRSILIIENVQVPQTASNDINNSPIIPTFSSSSSKLQSTATAAQTSQFTSDEITGSFYDSSSCYPHHIPTASDEQGNQVPIQFFKNNDPYSDNPSVFKCLDLPHLDSNKKKKETTKNDLTSQTYLNEEALKQWLKTFKECNPPTPGSKSFTETFRSYSSSSSEDQFNKANSNLGFFLDQSF